MQLLQEFRAMEAGDENLLSCIKFIEVFEVINDVGQM